MAGNPSQPGLTPEGAPPGLEGFGSFGHLALRFFGALDPRGPAPDEEAWALQFLLPGEQDLWRRMSGPDRRHAAGVARRVEAALGGGRPADGGAADGGVADGGAAGSGRVAGSGGVPREVMASALLHDVGKVVSGLGTLSRVCVTLAAIAVGRDRLVAHASPAEGWRAGGWRAGGWRAGGWRARAGDYLAHDRIGAGLLRDAGSQGTTVAWAAEHHLPPSRWTLEPKVAAALKAADGD